MRTDTRPPVDLYCFYLFLQREGGEDALDFWLDVQQHENLCRAYFRDLARAGVSVQEAWPRFAAYARSFGSIFAPVTNIFHGDPPPPGVFDDDDDDSDDGDSDDLGSIELDSERMRDDDERSFYEKSGRDTPSVAASIHNVDSSSSASHGQQQQQAEPASPADPAADVHSRYAAMRTPSPTFSHGSHYPLSPTLRKIYPHDHQHDHHRGGGPPHEATVDFDPEKRGSAQRPRQYSTSRRRSARIGGAQPFIPRDAAINRTDLIASAERIFSRYLMPGADKEVYLPKQLRVTSFPISSATLPSVARGRRARQEQDLQARIPDMFHAQKEYVYRSMETDSFPRFLRANAFGNLTPPSALLRLVLGLVALWVAFAAAFAFILLDAQPRTLRLWNILTFAVAFVLCLAHQYDLDIVLVALNLSETVRPSLLALSVTPSLTPVFSRPHRRRSGTSACARRTSASS